MMLKLQKSRTHNKLRTARGAYLLELLASIMISGFLAVMLSSSLSQVLRVTTESDKSFMAVSAAQEVIERVRATPFSELAVGETLVRINLPDGSGSNFADTLIAKRPLQIDASSLKWNSTNLSTNLPNYAFTGIVTLQITQPNPEIEAKNVQVKVEWTDTSGSQKLGPKKYETGTVVARYGLVRQN